MRFLPTLQGLEQALCLTDQELSDSSLAGFHLRIERLEALEHEAHRMLNTERRACLLAHTKVSMSHAE